MRYHDNTLTRSKTTCYHDNTLPCDNAFQWQHVTMTTCYHGNTLLCHTLPLPHVTMTPRYHDNTLQWQHVTMLPWHHVTMTTRFDDNTLPWQHVTMSMTARYHDSTLPLVMTTPEHCPQLASCKRCHDNPRALSTVGELQALSWQPQSIVYRLDCSTPHVLVVMISITSRDF
jgi:hypothetical protein